MDWRVSPQLPTTLVVIPTFQWCRILLVFQSILAYRMAALPAVAAVIVSVGALKTREWKSMEGQKSPLFNIITSVLQQPLELMWTRRTLRICVFLLSKQGGRFLSVNSPELIVVGLVGLVLWLVPGLALTKSKINSGELTDKYQAGLYLPI